MSSKAWRIASTGVFASLAFVLTAFCQIPYAGGAGYLNFGDLVTLFVSLSLGPIEGMLVGMIGSSLGDLFLGYAAFIPFTLIAKGLMALCSGFLFILLKKHKAVRFISPYIGAIIMILVYMLGYYFIEGAGVYMSSLFDCVQGALSSTIAILIYLPIEKSGILRRFLDK